MTDATVNDEFSLQGAVSSRDHCRRMAHVLDLFQSDNLDIQDNTYAELPDHTEAIQQYNDAADDFDEAIDSFRQCRDGEWEVA